MIKKEIIIPKLLEFMKNVSIFLKEIVIPKLIIFTKNTSHFLNVHAGHTARILKIVFYFTVLHTKRFSKSTFHFTALYTKLLFKEIKRLTRFIALKTHHMMESAKLRKVKASISNALPSAHTVLPQAALAHDFLVAFLSLFISLYLRVGDEFLNYSPIFILKNMLVFSLVSVSVFCWMQTHKGIWRYVSIEDVLPLSLAVVLSIVLYSPLMVFMAQQESLPRSIPAINALVLITLLIFPRFMYRLIHDHHLLQRRRLNSSTSIPVLLVGNDDQTELFIRELFHSPELAYRPVGLLTLNDDETGQYIHGVPILGAVYGLSKIIKDLESKNERPKQIIITEADIPSEVMLVLINEAATHGLTLMHMLQHFSLNAIKENIPSKKSSLKQAL